MLDETSKRRIKELCNAIANESDHDRFSQLVGELNQVFDTAESHFEEAPPILPIGSKNSL